MDNPELLERIWSRVSGKVDISGIRDSDDLQTRFDVDLPRFDDKGIDRSNGTQNIINHSRNFFKEIDEINDQAGRNVRRDIESANFDAVNSIRVDENFPDSLFNQLDNLKRERIETGRKQIQTEREKEERTELDKVIKESRERTQSEVQSLPDLPLKERFQGRIEKAKTAEDIQDIKKEIERTTDLRDKGLSLTGQEIIDTFGEDVTAEDLQRTYRLTDDEAQKLINNVLTIKERSE